MGRVCHFFPPWSFDPLETPTELTRVVDASMKADEAKFIAFLKIHKPLILWLGILVVVCVASFLIARY